MKHASRGFSITELVIVVTLLGLLAAVVIPRLTDPPGSHHLGDLMTALATLRSGVDSYRAQHDGYPGQGDEAELTSQLCRHTNAAGRPGAGPGFTLGPYVQLGRIPMNPILGINTVTIVDSMPSHPVGASAWLYDRNTGGIRANLHGNSPNGIRYFDL